MCFFKKLVGHLLVVRGLYSSFGGRQRVFHDGGLVINIGKVGDNVSWLETMFCFENYSKHIWMLQFKALSSCSKRTQKKNPQQKNKFST